MSGANESTPFMPSAAELVARARGDLRLGLPVVLEGGDRWLAAAVETLTPERLEALRRLGPPQLALAARRAATLRLPAYDGDLARAELPADADLAWLMAVADPARDLTWPFKGPLRGIRSGDAMPARLALELAKSAELLPAMLLVAAGEAVSRGLTRLRLDELTEGLAAQVQLAPVSAARLPMALARAGRLHVFRPESGGAEHYAVEIGTPDRATPVLARLHSACFTGDVLGSLKCDCGAQLRAALAAMGREGAGVLLYLNQEGRGIGLANKMRAYALQDQGFDTVEANHRLGFEDDERDFRLGAGILRQMGFRAVRLMTNNPRKVAMMEAAGIRVAERVPLAVGETEENRAYLATKARKSGHLL